MTQDEINAETVRRIRDRLDLPADASDADVLRLADTTFNGASIRLDVAWEAFWHPLKLRRLTAPPT